MDLTGQTLSQYRIMEKIGRGGMADVYKAFQPRLERYVAIKVLPPALAREETFLERFNREARAVASLRHPNILTIHDYGEQEGLTYLVMEYVEGGTLKQRLGQPLDIQWATEIIGRVGDALAYAHRRGVIHRDVKPANVLMQEEDWPLLTDFGLAKMVEQSVQLTKSGIVGTPEYMSPEQGQGLEIDERTDIYSLGIVLYEMVTGQKPFQADTPIAVLLKHVSAPLPLPRQVNPGIPELIELVILKAMAKSPEDRFQRMGEMVRALEEADAEIAAAAREAERRAGAEEEKLEGLYRQATAAQQDGQWAEAIGLFEEILRLWPDYQDARAHLSAAQRALEEKERREKEEKLAVLYGQAEEALEARQWVKATELLEEVLALDADYRDAASRLSTAREEIQQEEKERQLAELYERGLGHLQAQEWSQTVACFEELERLEPGYRDVAQRLATARAEIERLAEEERRRVEAGALYRQGREAVEAQQWSEAMEAFEQALALVPGYEDAEALLAKARAERAKLEEEAEWVEKARAEAAVLPAEVVKPEALEGEAFISFWRKVPLWGWVAVGAAVLLIVAGAIFLSGRGGKLTPAPVAMPAPTPTVLPTVTSVPVVSTATPSPTDTPYPTSTPLPTDTPILPTPTPAMPTDTPTPTPTPLPPTDTPTPVLPTDTPTPAYLFLPDGPARSDISHPCPGPEAPAHIVGTVRDAGGNPLGGVRLVCYNDWHRYPVVDSREGSDVGQYDFPVLHTPATWYVVVLDEADRPISPEAAVAFDPSLSCRYVQDWRRTY